MKLTTGITACFSFVLAKANPDKFLRQRRELQPSNDLCENAIFVRPDTIGAPIVLGSTTGASDEVGCAGRRFAVHYRFAGTGGRFKLSTCHEGTSYDSALYVDSLPCDGIGCGIVNKEHDFECDEEGYGVTVELYTEENTSYHIAVAGASATDVGDFALSVQKFVRPPNDVCQQAEFLEPSTDAEPIVFGSTLNATITVVSCEGPKTMVFYQFLGTGGPFLISTCNNATDYNSALLLTSTACDSFGCGTTAENDHAFDCDEQGMGSTIRFVSEESTLYTLGVRGVSLTDTGNFGLILQKFVRPENDVCDNPEPIQPFEAEEEHSVNATSSSSVSKQNINASSIVVQGTTLNSTGSVHSWCLSGGPGVYYSVMGTGQRFRASTCSPETDFDSIIHVYTGICSEGKCGYVAHENEHDFSCDARGLAATVEWETEADTLYTIAVGGVAKTDRGNFELSLEAFGNKTEQGMCEWVQVCDDDDEDNGIGF